VVEKGRILKKILLVQEEGEDYAIIFQMPVNVF